MSIFSSWFKPKPNISELPTVQLDQEPVVTKDVGVNGFANPGLLFALGGYPSDTGTPVTPYTALQASAVYACVKVLSEDVAKLPLRVRKRLAGGGWAIASDHPLTGLLRSPN